MMLDACRSITNFTFINLQGMTFLNCSNYDISKLP